MTDKNLRGLHGMMHHLKVFQVRNYNILKGFEEIFPAVDLGAPAFG